MTQRSHIVAAKRSAVLPKGGGFRELQLHEIVAPVIRAALTGAGIEAAEVGEVILGNALGAGGNPARVAALASGLPESVAGLTVDRQCCGGMDAILLADALVSSGLHQVVVAGGVESYSCRPIRMRSARYGAEPQIYDQPPFTPWPDRDPDMTAAADALAAKLGISREAQEAWAIDSHAKAIAARTEMQLDEIVPVAGQTEDSFARQLTPALCARARPLAGSVTAATTAVAADGAAICVVVSPEIARIKGLSGAVILGGITIGADPVLPGLAPVAAIRASLDAAGLTAANLAAVEIMEAYAVQAIACQRVSGIDPGILNRGGGGLARGHPVGASGAINVVRLFHELRRSGGTGLAAIAAAGGLGTALLLGR